MEEVDEKEPFAGAKNAKLRSRIERNSTPANGAFIVSCFPSKPDFSLNSSKWRFFAPAGLTNMMHADTEVGAL